MEASYLGYYILIASRVHDIVTNQHDICVLVGKGAQAIVVLLPWNTQNALDQRTLCP